MPSFHNLYGYQQEGVDFALSKKYSINADEMGLGKSLQALCAAEHTGLPTLIICPPYLKHNWVSEVKKWTNSKVRIFDPKEELDSKDRYIVAGYTDLKFLYKDFEWAKFIIADEAHYLKSVDSQRTELFFNLFNKYPPQYFLALTGTPIKNRIPEIYTLLVLMGMEKSRTLKIQKDFRSYYMFCHNFTNPRTVKYGQKSVTKFEGHKNIDQLKLYLKDCYIRRKAEDVLNLPEVVEEFIKVEYGESEKELREAWEAYSTGKVIANSTVKRDTALAKSRFTSDYLSGLLEVEERNIVVFSHHPAAAERIHDAIKGKTKSYLITGSTEVSARHKYAEEFAKEVGSVLVATIDSFSTGVNLVSANHLVFNDLSWVPSDNDQALKRIHRIGQTKTCFIHYIVGGSVDDSISRMLSRKSNVIKRLI